MLGRKSTNSMSNSSEALAGETLNSITDFISQYLFPFSPERQVRLAKQILNKTSLGQKKMITPEVGGDGILRYRSGYFDSEVTGGRKLFDNLEDAIQYLNSMGVTEGYHIGQDNIPSVYRGYGEVVKTISQKTNRNIEMNIAIHKSGGSSRQDREALENFYKIQRQKASMLLPTDDGAVAFNFIEKIGDTQRVLSLDETLELMEAADVSIFQQDKLMEALKGGNAKLGKLIQKLDKRLRGVLSPREVSVSGDLLSKVLGTSAGAIEEGMLGKAVLVTDPIFEKLAIFTGVDTVSGLAEGTMARDAAEFVREMYNVEGMGTQKYVDNLVNEVLDEVMQVHGVSSSAKADIVSSIKQFVGQAYTGGNIDMEGGYFGTDEFKKVLKASGISDEYKDVIGTLMDELEKGDDGSSLINKYHTTRIQNELKKEISSLDSKIGKETNKLKLDDLLSKRLEFQKVVDQLDESRGLSQVTVRGNIVRKLKGLTPEGQEKFSIFSLKSAGQVVDFMDKYNKYAIITSKAGTKAETAISGLTEILNLSGTGEAKGLVYYEPMIGAFHKGLFGSEQAIELSRLHSEQMQAEISEIFKTGRLSEDHKLYKSLIASANDNLDDLMDTQQFSKLAHRTMAREILEMVRSGVPINEHPRLANMLLDFSQKEFFKLKNGVPMPALGDVYRFALNSETVGGGAKNARRFLTGEAENILIDDATGKIKLSTSRVRFSNHNLLMSERDVIRFHHSLGGFDLDDKGLPVLGTYMSDGKRKLAMAMVRQPTGAGEAIGLVRFQDIESYQELFGHNQFFMKTLNEMIDEQARGSIQGVFPVSMNTQAIERGQKYERLRQVLAGENTDIGLLDQDTAFLDELEGLIIDVRDRLYKGNARVFDRKYFESIGAKISEDNSVIKFGATSLVDLAGKDPDLANLVYERMKTDVMNINLEGDVFGALKHLMGEDKRTQLGGIVTKIQDLEKEALEIKGGQRIPPGFFQGSTEDAKLQRLKQIDEEMSTLSKEFYKGTEGLDQKGVTRAMNKLYTELTANAATQEGSILGVHVNRATAIADGLRQFDEAFGSNQSVQDLIKKHNLKIGFPSSETAVDMTQTFTSGRLKFALEKDIADQNPLQASLAFKKLYGSNFNLEEHGVESLNQFGKIFGLLQGHEGQNFFIDEAMFRFGKLNKEDLITVSKGFAEGRRLAIGEGGLSADQVKKFEDEINLIESLTTRDPSKKDLINSLRGIGLIGKGQISKTLAVAEQSQIALEAQRLQASQSIDALRRELIADRGLSSKVSTASKKIVEDNKSLIDEIVSINKEIRDASKSMEKFGIDSEELMGLRETIEYNKPLLEAKKMQLGDNFLEQIKNAKLLGENITGSQLMAGVQLEAMDAGMSSFLFEKLPDTVADAEDNSVNFFLRVQDAMRAKRNYGKQVQNIHRKQLVEDFYQALEDQGDAGKIVKAGILKAEKSLDLRGYEHLLDGIDIETMQKALISSANVDDERAKGLADAIRSKIVYENSVADKSIDDFLNGTTAAADVIKPGNVDKNTPKIVREILDDFSTPGKPRVSNIKLINMEYLKEQFSKPAVRNVAIGIGATIVASFLYQSKKDRSRDDMAGPPLLPGGSPYESGIPNPQAMPPELGGQGYTSGMNYKVSLYGSSGDVEKFRAAAAGLTNGKINSTMYNRIPNVASDPYQQIATSF